MKKYTLLLGLSVWMLLFLTACHVSGETAKEQERQVVSEAPPEADPIPTTAESETNDTVYYDTGEIFAINDETVGFTLTEVEQKLEEMKVTGLWIVEMDQDIWTSAESYIKDNTLEYTAKDAGRYLLLGEKADGSYVNLKEFCGEIQVLKEDRINNGE